jgi:hypothetical protein
MVERVSPTVAHSTERTSWQQKRYIQNELELLYVKETGKAAYEADGFGRGMFPTLDYTEWLETKLQSFINVFVKG